MTHQLNVWVKYNLHKDGTPVWAGLPNMESAQQRIVELRRQGYHPIIDRKMSGLGKQPDDAITDSQYFVIDGGAA